MKLAEYIEKLSKLDPNAEVFVMGNEFGYDLAKDPQPIELKKRWIIIDKYYGGPYDAKSPIPSIISPKIKGVLISRH